MKIQDYVPEKELGAIAKQIGIPYPTLRNVWTGKRKPSLELSIRISQGLDNKVSVADLRPDLAALIGQIPEAAND